MMGGMRGSTDGLTARDSAVFRRELLAARRAAVKQLEQVDETLSDVQASRSDGVADDEHDPEGPTMSFEWSLLSGTRDDTRAELVAIEAALDRLDQGTYGICARCGRPIGAARLRARPFAELCIDCARLAEGNA